MNLMNKLNKKQNIVLVLFLAFNIILCIFCYNILHKGVNSTYVLKLMTFSNLKVLMSAYTIVSTLALGGIFYFYNKDVYGIKSKNLIVVSFFLVMSVSVLIMIVLGYLTHGETIRSMLHNNKNDVFMDYFNSIQYGTKPYGRQVIYPPLINVVYGFLGRFFVKDGLGTPLYRVNQLASMTFLFYSMATYYFLYYSFKKFSIVYFKEFELKVLFVLLLMSLPYLYLMERANSLILVIALLFIFCTAIESPSIHSKWVSMITLSLAASIKITPCIFGILFLRNRDIKSALKCFVVGVLVFNIPFVLTDGNLMLLIENIRNTTQAFQGYVIDGLGIMHLIGNGHYVNLGNTVTILERLIGIESFYLKSLLNMVIFCCSVLIVLFSKEADKWQCLALLCGIIVLCPGFSAIYNLTYYTIPLVCFLGSKPKVSVKNITYLILFLLIFIPIINFKLPYLQLVSGNDMYPMRISTIVESFSILILSMVLILEIGYKEFRKSFTNSRAE